MPYQFIAPPGLEQQHWVLAHVYTPAGDKLTLNESIAGLTVNRKTLKGHTLVQDFALAPQLPPSEQGLMKAANPLALVARRVCYQEALAAFTAEANRDGLRQPCPTPATYQSGRWVVQVRAACKGSPLLALALIDDTSLDSWVVVQSGAYWQASSAISFPKLPQLAHRLRSYGRLSLKLSQNSQVVQVGQGNKAILGPDDLPFDLRQAA